MNHDQNFKNLILDYPREAIRFFAAEEAAGIDAAARILPIRQEQLKERLGERFRELDTPLLVEWPDGEREAILFVFEEETEPRRFSIHRLAHYCLELAELYETDRVAPVVIFLRAGNHARELVLGSEHKRYLSFFYLHCALADLPFESYRDSDNIVARLNLPNMAFAPEQRLEAHAYAVRGLATLETDPERQLKYMDFIEFYGELDDDERKRYHQLYPEEHETMTLFSERFIQQGMQQGMRQGRQQGLRQGEARVLLRQLAMKFGDLPSEIRARVENADDATLLRWSERVLTASSLDEVLH